MKERLETPDHSVHKILPLGGGCAGVNRSKQGRENNYLVSSGTELEMYVNL